MGINGSINFSDWEILNLVASKWTSPSSLIFHHFNFNGLIVSPNDLNDQEFDSHQEFDRWIVLIPYE